MTREEAIHRIKEHMVHHGIGRFPHILLAEAMKMAISALREQEERSKGCEYCDGKQKFLPCCDGYSSFNVIGFEAAGKPYLNDVDGCDIWIKFCPMCGRKLEVEG